MEHIKLNNWKSEYEVISFLRFPLTVLVIFIHAWGKGLIINGEYLDFGLSNYPVFNNIAYIFSEILGRISVPTFFMISGFLLFLILERFVPSFLNILTGARAKRNL